MQPRRFPSENNLTRRVQPLIQDSPVNAAEAGVEFKITVTEVRQGSDISRTTPDLLPLPEPTLEQVRRDRFRHLHFLRHGGRIR